MLSYYFVARRCRVLNRINAERAKLGKDGVL